LWIGTKGRKEEDLVPRAGIPLETLKLSGLQRDLSLSAAWRNARSILNWLTAAPFIKAHAILKKFQPDFVLGTGGYVCAPLLITAKMMGLRRWILEQNSIPGMTVKMLARWVDGVGIAYESSRPLLKSAKRIELVGNPAPASIVEANREEGIQFYELDPRRRTLLVIGGSLGSEVLNRGVGDLIKLMQKSSESINWQILHSTGQTKYDEFIRSAGIQPFHHARPFLYRPDLALAAADLVLCRGGAMTLAEITARGVPSIIVPWPGAVRNHQFHNAKSLADNGAAILIPETNFSGQSLMESILSLSAQPSRLESLARNAKVMGKPDSASIVVDIILGSEQ
jgi:UDP-N-acetylglucosamine--N-acetylmuramyl-(pentapeptide) pyrophosphoryl-undecaprenol N-acetylglucosamine transferase